MANCDYRQLIDDTLLDAAFGNFHGAAPFDHCVVDGFLRTQALPELEAEFPAYDSERWFRYKNAIEDKKTLNDWNAFPPATYRFFSLLNAPQFVERLSELVGVRLYSDNGLHGGGWHVHGTGGNLNPHLDYSLHPKLSVQRKLNIIVYLSRELRQEHGGHLGLWEADPLEERPGRLVHEIEPKFNRAAIFDTTQQSWHGLSRPLIQPEGVLRKSLAIYYLCDPPEDVDRRGRALFAPRENQLGDPRVEDLIRLRSDIRTSSKVYQQ